MGQKQKRQGSSPLVIIAIAAGVIVLIGAVAVGAFIVLSGDGEASQAASDAAADLETSDTQAQVYEIEEAGTTARFYIDEVLRGEDVTVVGETNQVGGQLTIDPANPDESDVGEIVINARTLQTDNGSRNRALRLFILRSANDEYEFIRFQPTELSGLPSDPVNKGTSIEFQITGDLTIVETTNTVTFDVQATLGTDDVLEGTATTTIAYPDFNLTIPEVPQVASVADSVRLELEFIATPATTETPDG